MRKLVHKLLAVVFNQAAALNGEYYTKFNFILAFQAFFCFLVRPLIIFPIPIILAIFLSSLAIIQLGFLRIRVLSFILSSFIPFICLALSILVLSHPSYHFLRPPTFLQPSLSLFPFRLSNLSFFQLRHSSLPFSTPKHSRVLPLPTCLLSSLSSWLVIHSTFLAVCLSWLSSPLFFSPASSCSGSALLSLPIFRNIPAALNSLRLCYPLCIDFLSVSLPLLSSFLPFILIIQLSTSFPICPCIA